jgi:hypothetical protein
MPLILACSLESDLQAIVLSMSPIRLATGSSSSSRGRDASQIPACGVFNS